MNILWTLRRKLEGRQDIHHRSWHTERCLRLQSANFGRICKATDRTDFIKLAQSFLRIEKVKAEPIQQCRNYEPVAIKAYEEKTGVQTRQCGIYVSKEHPFLGSSSDGIVSDDLLVEVKCPYTSRDKLVSPSTVPYLIEKEDKLSLDENHDYYYQVH